MKSSRLLYMSIGLVIAVAAIVSLLPAPDALSSTYVVALALMIGVVFVILMTWRNAQPSDTVGQLLQRTETEDRTRRR